MYVRICVDIYVLPDVYMHLLPSMQNYQNLLDDDVKFDEVHRKNYQ
jgi:hypothetical protein